MVELIGFYGGDETHALSAWTSTRRELTPDKIERIGPLLSFLAENGHHTPFEKSMLHFLVTCDTASHIHILKHRVGVSVNAESARYKELTEDKSYTPNDWPDFLKVALDRHVDKSFSFYHDAVEELTPRLGRKRAKESARFFLPYAAGLTLDVSFNFRSFMHFVGLRGAEDAQQEIQTITQRMVKLVRRTEAFNLSLEAFNANL